MGVATVCARSAPAALSGARGRQHSWEVASGGAGWATGWHALAVKKAP